ncbi:hypothetical protein [Methylococcus sp. EFPC2]|uniref:hypothetical protein n=1 Tax=Methylococcus sp. EFPC2 TaxID=2812648 RepID=UPI001F071939|nr:hypothetical protein [Methylococcus sp. EFPC2]
MSEIQEPVELIAEGEVYALRSCGNGVTYILSSKEENSSAHVEGDDVAGFLEAYEATKSQYPDYDTDQVLAQLWDQGGYSWMAVPDEA